jgi:acyl-CoA thioesterase FadM
MTIHSMCPERQEAPPQDLSFVCHRTILYGDCDPAGWVYTPRVAHFAGLLPPARQLKIEFITPLTYDDKIGLMVTVLRVGRTSFACQVEATRDNGAIAFQAELTQVCIDPTTKRPVSLPDSIRHQLQRHLLAKEHHRRASGPRS